MDVDIPSKRRPRHLANNFAVAKPLGKANAPEFENQNPGQIFLNLRFTTWNPLEGTRSNHRKGVMH
jgi:hypothetical protein